MSNKNYSRSSVNGVDDLLLFGLFLSRSLLPLWPKYSKIKAHWRFAFGQKWSMTKSLKKFDIFFTFVLQTGLLFIPRFWSPCIGVSPFLKLEGTEEETAI